MADAHRRRSLRLRAGTWVLNAVTGVALLLAVAGLLMRIGVMRVNADPSALLARVGDALGGTLQVEQFAASFSGFEPVLDLRGVRLTTVAGDALLIDRLQVQLDPFESVMRRGVLASGLLAQGVRIRVTQRDDGSWGLPGTPGGGAAPPLTPVRRFLLQSDAVHLADGAVTVEPLDAPAVTLTGLDARLTNTWGFHRGSLDASWQGGGDGHLQARFRFRGDDGWKSQWGTVWLQLSGVDLGWWSGLVAAPGAAPALDGTLELFEGWLAVQDGEPVQVHGELDLPEVAAAELANGRPLTGLHVAGQLRRDRDTWQFAATELEARHRDTRLDLAGLRAAGRGDIWWLRLPELGIADWLGVLDREGVLGEAGRKAVADLQPRGQLENFRGRLDLRAERPAWICTASVHDLELTAHKGAPGVRDGDASLLVSDAGGRIEVADDAIGLRFAEVYDRMLELTETRGTLWFGFGDGIFRIHSGLLQATLEEQRVHGQFALYRPQAAPLDRAVTLLLGTPETDLARLGDYLPLRLAPGLRRWLGGSVKAGSATDVGVQLHGHMRPVDGQRRSGSAIAADISGARLRFHPEWPEVTAATAVLQLGPLGTRVRLPEAAFLGVDLASMQAWVPAIGEPRLEIDARTATDAGAVLRILRDTPLRDLVPQAQMPWAAAGPVRADLALEVGFGSEGTRVTRVDVAAQLDGVDLGQPEWDLAVRDIRGPLRYALPTRFSSTGLDARWLDSPLQVRLLGGDNGEPVHLDLAGSVAPAALRGWLGIPLLTRLGADVPWQGRLSLPTDGGSVVLRAGSDLQGVPILAPAPLGKPAEEVRLLDVVTLFPADRPMEVRLQVGPELRGRFLLPGGEPALGSVVLGGTDPALPDEPGIVISGAVAAADAVAWLDLVEDPGLDGVPEDNAPALGNQPEQGGFDTTTLRVAGLAVDALTIAEDAVLDPLRLDVAHEGNAWAVLLQADHLTGSVRVPDDGGVPRLELTELRLPDALAGAAGEPGAEDAPSVDPLAGVDRRDLPEVDVQVDALWLGGEPFGTWSFEVRQTPGGLLVDRLHADVRAMTIGAWPQEDAAAATEADEGAEVLWTDAGDTRFRGLLAGDNVADVLSAWGYAASVESERLAARARVRWPGSPLAVDLANLVGEVQVDVREGRFVEVDTAGGGNALRVLGILDFTAIARRARLDFSDVFQRGITFDSIEGTVRLNEGLLQFPEPLVISGPGSLFRLQGEVDMVSGALTNEMIVTLPVNRALPWYAAYAALFANPLAGAGVLVAERVFRNQIEAVSSARYRIGGTLDEPQVEFMAVFDNRMQEVPVEDLPDLTTDPSDLEDPGAFLPVPGEVAQAATVDAAADADAEVPVDSPAPADAGPANPNPQPPPG